MMTLQDRQKINSLREFMEMNPRRGEFYHKELLRREHDLPRRTYELWVGTPSGKMTEMLNTPLEVGRKDEVTIWEASGRYYFTIDGVRVGGDLSSDSSITSRGRLMAHAESVRDTERAKNNDFVMGQFKASEINDTFASIKRDMLRKEGKNFKFSAEIEMVPVDVNGERTSVNGETLFADGNRITFKELKHVFDAYPTTIQISISACLYWVDTDLPLKYQWENREPSDEYAVLTVWRA